ncbi:MAG: DNA topoisomerase IV subunit B, partial [Oscillospiraceae bacterium]|nr:DNA topoisomerase IV subunit B [Oscillospiraceae bacterium]
IIMADADVDGSHIRTLLLTFFFRFMRPLITNGNIYLAQPPLFKVSKGKKFRYAFDEAERDKFIEELTAADKSNSKIEVQRYKGLGEMSSQQLWDTTMNPETRSMIRVELDDAERADAVFSILMGDKVAPRREFIETNAKYVKYLDI